PENVGLFRNYNQFYLDRTTDYVLVLPDDDVLHPRFLERTVAALDDHPRAGLVHTGFDLVDRDGQLIGGGNWTGGVVEDTGEAPGGIIGGMVEGGCWGLAAPGVRSQAANPGAGQ